MISHLFSKCIVMSVFCGQEKELIHLKTQNGKELLLTHGHPVRCARGVLPASELNASDIITTVDGASPIAWLFRKHGDYAVYSLALDPPAMLYCNGVEAGDFDAQNSILHAPEPLTPMEMELHNELRLLLGEREKRNDWDSNSNVAKARRWNDCSNGLSF